MRLIKGLLMKKIISIFLFILFFSPTVFCFPSKLTLFTEPYDGGTIDGKQTLLNAMNNAQKSIDLEIYQISDTDLISALEAQGPRIPVRVILQPNLWPNPSSSTPDPQQLALQAQLENHHIQVKWGKQQFPYTHIKCLVIDHETAYIMTMNWSRSAFTKNREFGIIDTSSPDVTEIENVFQSDWNTTDLPLILSDPRLLWSPNNARDKITHLLNEATKTLYMEGEVFEDPQLENTLITLAKQSVDIRLIISYPDDDEQKTEIQNLIANGVKVRILDSTQHPPMGNLYMHAKMFLVNAPVIGGEDALSNDAKAYVGSINYLTQSLDQNRELGIQFSDLNIISSLYATFQDDWNHAEPFPAIPELSFK